MATFAELQQHHEALKGRVNVLQHLIEYIDNTFRPIAGADPKQRLLDDRNVAIPPEMFEAVVSEVLVTASKSYRDQIDAINNTPLVQATQQAQPAEQGRKKSKTT
jgi:hypothetical protein